MIKYYQYKKSEVYVLDDEDFKYKYCEYDTSFNDVPTYFIPNDIEEEVTIYFEREKLDDELLHTLRCMKLRGYLYLKNGDNFLMVVIKYPKKISDIYGDRPIIEYVCIVDRYFTDSDQIKKVIDRKIKIDKILND